MNGAIEFARQRIQDHLSAAGHQINAYWYSLRHEPHREHQFVEFYFGQDHGPPLRIFTKLLTSGGGQTAFGAQHWLDSQLTPHNVLAVPKPILYDSQHGIFAMQQVQGRDVRQVHLSITATEDIRRIGSALATLHNLPVPNLPSKIMADHLTELVRPHPLTLAARLPAYRDQIQDTLRWLEATAERYTFVATPIHRDFQLRQILLQEQVSVLDWDTFAVGDPAFDVAYFLVYLETHLPAASAKELSTDFLAAYGESREWSESQTDLIARIPLYQAFNYLRRACRRIRLQDTRWQTEVERMLQLCHSTVDP